MDKTRVIARVFFSAQQRESVYERFAALTDNGVSLRESLALTLNRFERRRNPLRFVFRAVLTGLNSGRSLDQALSAFVPGEEAMLIQSGLASGELPTALRRCAELLRARHAITSSVSQALGYPILLSLLFLALLVVLSRYVMPQLAQLSDPVTWEPGAQALYAAARFVDSPVGWIALAVVVCLVLLALVTLGRFTGRLRVVLDRVPPWSFYRLIIGSIWLFTLATLLRSGVQLSHALASMSVQPTTSPWLRERIQAISRGLAHGQDLGVALDNAGHQFPDAELVEDILVYSRLPGFSDRLHVIATAWLAAGVGRVQIQAKILNVVCILAILLLLSGVGLAVSSLQQQMGHLAF